MIRLKKRQVAPVRMIIKRKKMKKGMMATLMMLWILMWSLTHQLAHQLSLVTLTSKYDPCDPAGLKLGNLSTHDATHYHLIKSTCEKAGQLQEWKESLNNTVVELSSTLSTQTLTNAHSKKAAKKILQELQHYVCLLTFYNSTS